MRVAIIDLALALVFATSCVTDPKAFCLTPCAGLIWAPLGVVSACAPQAVDDAALDSERDAGP